MTATSPAVPASRAAVPRRVYLSELLGRPLTAVGGQPFGRLADIIVRLRGTHYPLVTGLVARVDRREVFIPARQVSDFTGRAVEFASAKVDLRRFKRREGEVLLRADVLGYRLLEVSRARLVRAGDLRLSDAGGAWVLGAIDTRWRPRRLPRFLGGRERQHEARDWQEFEPLIGHACTARSRGRFTRVRRLKPAQIADLLEEARSFRDAKGFYVTFTGLVVIAAAIVLIPGAPLGVVTEAVQALAGLLLPSASVFLLLLCNDREVLVPWVNRGWLNVVATVIVATLLTLSGTLMATTIFPHVNATQISLWLSGALAAGLAVMGIALRVTRTRRDIRETKPPPARERTDWRMPPLPLLKPVTWSPTLKIGMLALRGYLLIAVLLLFIKAIQLGAG